MTTLSLIARSIVEAQPSPAPRRSSHRRPQAHPANKKPPGLRRRRCWRARKGARRQVRRRTRMNRSFVMSPVIVVDRSPIRQAWRPRHFPAYSAPGAPAVVLGDAAVATAMVQQGCAGPSRRPSRAPCRARAGGPRSRRPVRCRSRRRRQPRPVPGSPTVPGATRPLRTCRPRSPRSVRRSRPGRGRAR